MPAIERNVATAASVAVDMVDASGAPVGVVPSVSVSLDRADYVAGAGVLVNVSSQPGEWEYVPTQAELNCAKLRIRATGAGARSVVRELFPEAQYTAARGGRLDNLDASVGSRGTSNYAGGAVASVTAGVTLAAGQDVRHVTGALAAAERAAIAGAVATELLTPNDGQQVIQAIVNAINAADVNLAGLSTAAIAAAVRAALEGSGSFLAAIKGKTDLVQLDGSGFVRSVAQNLPVDYQQRGVAVTLPAAAPAAWRAVLAALQPDYAPARAGDVVVNPALTPGQAATLSNLDGLMEASGGHGRFRATALEAAPVSPLSADGIWGYPYRSLTGLQVDGSPTASPADGGGRSIVRGDTTYFDVPVPTDCSAAAQVWVTLKADPSQQADAQADLQATKSGGLTTLAGGAPGAGATATLSFPAGFVRVTLSAGASARLTAGTLHGDVQVQDGGGNRTPVFFRLLVRRDVTQAV